MKSNFVRFCGLMAILGGLYLLVLAGLQAFRGGDIEDMGLIWRSITIMPIMLTFGAAGLFALAGDRRWLQAGAAITALGTVLMAAGFAMMTWLDNDNGWGVWFLGMVLLPLGFLLFGLANRRARVLARWNGVPLIVGLAASLILVFSIVGSEQLNLFTEQQGEMLFAIYLLLLGIGWLILGVDLMRSGQNTAVPVVVSLLVLFFLLSACSAGGSKAKVSFQSPKSGDTVSSPLQVIMRAENFTVEEAGEIHQGAGHLHIMVDTPCLPAGEVIPKDASHIHYGDGRTEADLELTSGRHTLCLQAADGTHIALEGAGMTHQIEITVP